MSERAFIPVVCILLALASAPIRPLLSQSPQSLEDSRRRLDEIRAERSRLQAQAERLKGQAHDVADELSNLERQKESTSRIVSELERQVKGLFNQLDRSSTELVLAQDNLAERRGVLERRLVDIYKRGQLYTFQVLLTAESFGDLLSRYKYLYLTSRQDRALVSDVELLKNRVVRQRRDILNVKGELDRRRTEREAELDRYGSLARERAARLAVLERAGRNTEKKLVTLAHDEQRLNNVLAALERSRREEAARGSLRGTPATPGTLTTSALGKLDWPVDGTIVYRFGRASLPSGGVIRYNGIGIAAPLGTSVRVVEGGTVAMVQRLGTYGLTVAIDHGGGVYSLYMQLENAAVKSGQKVGKGQTIGTVGGANSDYGPHLHFEIRGQNQQALDPAEWLKRR
jgi:septal ring factor EnvC (AmiA/AmiB activator)